MGGKRTQSDALKSALQPLHAHNPAPGHYRNRKHANPTVVRPFGTDLGVEDETEFAVDRIGPHPFQGALGRVAIARHRPVAVDRRSIREAKQLVDLFGPGQTVVMRNVAFPVTEPRILLAAGYIGRVYEDVAV